MRIKNVLFACLVAAFAVHAQTNTVEIRMSLADHFVVAPTSAWNVTVLKYMTLRQANIEIKSSDNREFNLKLYFICDTDDMAEFNTPNKMKKAVMSSSQEYLPEIVEKTIDIKAFSAKGRYGFATVFTDKKLCTLAKVEPGEYKFMTTGMLRLSDDTALGFNLMTNSTNSPQYKNLLEYVKSFTTDQRGTGGYDASRSKSNAVIEDVVVQIERFAALGKNDDRSLIESISEGIEENPARVSKALIQKISDKNLPEQQLVVYLWALGLTKDQTAVAAIEALHTHNTSDLVRAQCLSALGTIGGTHAEKFLLSALDVTTNQTMQFDILNLLGQMQCEAAVPKTEGLLKQDPKLYWQSVFVFGKMGDKAVPFLLKRINDKDHNVRANVINILGRWLIPPEAAKPLQQLFWTEKDAQLRGMILGSLANVANDFAQMKTFLDQVVAKEKDTEMVKYAQDTLDTIDQARAGLAGIAKTHKASAISFQREYAQLFKSAGKKGDYEILEISSAAQDEQKLKVLRERILQRNSDEAFDDYQKVNGIIALNRMLAQNNKAAKP